MKKRKLLSTVKNVSLLTEMEQIEVLGGYEPHQNLSPDNICRDNDTCESNSPCSENVSCNNNQSCSGNDNCIDKIICNHKCC